MPAAFGGYFLKSVGPAAIASALGSAFGQELADQPVDDVGSLEVQEVAGVVDDLGPRARCRERRARQLGKVGAHATIGPAVEVQRGERRRLGRGVLQRLDLWAGVDADAPERGAVVADGGGQVGGVAQGGLYVGQVLAGGVAR